MAIPIEERPGTKGASTVPYKHNRTSYPRRLISKEFVNQGRGSGAAGRIGLWHEQAYRIKANGN